MNTLDNLDIKHENKFDDDLTKTGKEGLFELLSTGKGLKKNRHRDRKKNVDENRIFKRKIPAPGSMLE